MTFEEIVRIRDDYYIHSTSARLDDRTRVMKHGDTFAVFDRFGDIESFGVGELGIYHQDTRFLSRLVLRLGGLRLLLLGSTINQNDLSLAVDLMNPDFRSAGELAIPRGTVHLFRSKVLWQADCHERLRIHNYGEAAVSHVLSFEYDADFADIFEVRGTRRERRGDRLRTEISEATVVLGYRGLDGRERRTRLTFDPAPIRISETRADFDVRLSPREETTVELTVACDLDTPRAVPPRRASYDQAARQAGAALRRERADEPEIATSSGPFDRWLARSLADLHMMRTATPYGDYPYAGVPWFSTVFGRDGIVTALQCLWLDPGMARGVLRTLAATQADGERPERDAEPGKILHETRSGEMAALGEVPFGRYYGSVDATPLFVALAGAHLERTGDLELTRSLWPHVERALSWMEEHGDRDRDGFLEYHRRSERGLVHQGWKDSRHSVFHADGADAEGPIALCEVQGYAFAARLAAARMAEALGLPARASALRDAAETLRERFEEAFWCEEIGSYALALDGSKRPCRVVASNAGHCLFAGVAEPERARRVAATLTGDACHSGWGVRTLAATETRYNPMSYHNGSVWPHDNSLFAAGCARYGLREEALRILEGMFDASTAFDLHRLPELFCGFHRRPGESPTAYPVSCSPQAWASGSVFLLLQACLGLEIRAREGSLVFRNPILPEALERVVIRGLRVGAARLDLKLTRQGRGVEVAVPRREGDLSVVTLA